MTRLVFVSAFALALALQGWGFVSIGTGGLQLWGNEPLYIEQGNPLAFDVNLAYGHPGGTIVIGAGALEAAGLAPKAATEAFLALADALVIALIVTLCYALRGSLWWASIAGIILATDPLYARSTPPSSLASLLFVLLALLTLRILEGSRGRWLAAWGLCAGLLIATRFDIGLAATLALGALLAARVGGRSLKVPVLAAVLGFLLTDPFMWFMPLRHLADMAHKFAYHYEAYAGPVPTDTLWAILRWTPFAFAGMLCALAALRSREAPLPRAFVFTLAALTVLCGAVILSSSYRSAHYVQPFILLWEIVLPLYILRFGSPRAAARLLAALLAFYPLVIYAVYAF